MRGERARGVAWRHPQRHTLCTKPQVPEAPVDTQTAKQISTRDKARLVVLSGGKLVLEI